MKAQFAIAEALASLIFLSALMGISVIALNNAYGAALESSTFSVENIAAYDFIKEAYTNSSLGACIDSSFDGSSCIINYLEIYKATYHLDGIEFWANKSFGLGNQSVYSIMRCFPYGHRVACLYLSG